MSRKTNLSASRRHRVGQLNNQLHEMIPTGLLGTVFYSETRRGYFLNLWGPGIPVIEREVSSDPTLFTCEAERMIKEVKACG